MNRAQLEQTKTTNLKSARELADKALAEGRDFTNAERAAVEDHVAKAREADRGLKALDGDDALIAELNALGSRRGLRATRPDRGDGMWAKEMTTHLGRVGAKALTTSGTITVPALSSGLTLIGDRPRSILQLIPFVDLAGTDEYAFIRETARTQAASTVAVGKKKPESAYELTKITDRVKTIAHLTTVDRSLVMDVDLLQSYLEGALRDGVELELEDQILNGNGAVTGVLDDMVGILNTGGIQGQAWDTDLLTTTRKAVTKMSVINELDPAGWAWCLHPSDVEKLDLLRDDSGGAGTGQFLLGDAGSRPPLDRARGTLWSIPITSTTAITAGTGLLGDFRGSVEIREREGVTVEWTQQGFVTDLFGAGVHGDLWEANKIRWRAEGRWGEAVKKAVAFVEVDLTAA